MSVLRISKRLVAQWKGLGWEEKEYKEEKLKLNLECYGEGNGRFENLVQRDNCLVKSHWLKVCLITFDAEMYQFYFYLIL